VLDESRNDLALLRAYLRVKKQLDVSVTLIHDPGHDAVNRRDPRAFCYVDADCPTAIRCASALEALHPPARIGVLLHEIGHIVLDAFDGDEAEIDVDSWCLDFVPEAGYTYMDTSYWRPGKKRPVTAKALEHVSLGFVHAVRNITIAGLGWPV